MSKKYKLLFFGSIIAVIAGVAALVAASSSFAVLNPQGIIAAKQRNLIVFTVLLSLVVVIPVYVMTIGIAWKYRAGNHSAKYSPDWDGSRLAETIWWGVPLALISILAVITWVSSHELDPFKSLDSAKQPLTIQVVALDWKWLFIYPEHNVASVNYFEFPAKTPVNFEITSDAPMNSFWIPQLGGQIYAMSGMSTELHLMADRNGEYRGSSANISGRGFANMHFTAHATSEQNFQEWINRAKATPNMLSFGDYQQLSRPGIYNFKPLYSAVDSHLYDTIVMKYMTPTVDVGQYSMGNQ